MPPVRYPRDRDRSLPRATRMLARGPARRGPRLARRDGSPPCSSGRRRRCCRAGSSSRSGTGHHLPPPRWPPGPLRHRRPGRPHRAARRGGLARRVLRGGRGAALPPPRGSHLAVLRRRSVRRVRGGRLRRALDRVPRHGGRAGRPRRGLGGLLRLRAPGRPAPPRGARAAGSRGVGRLHRWWDGPARVRAARPWHPAARTRSCTRGRFSAGAARALVALLRETAGLEPSGRPREPERA